MRWSNGKIIWLAPAWQHLKVACRARTFTFPLRNNYFDRASYGFDVQSAERNQEQAEVHSVVHLSFCVYRLWAA